MLLPVAALLLGGLLIYAGIHKMSVTDALGQMLGRQPSHSLGSLAGSDTSSNADPGSYGLMTSATKVKGHSELRSNISSVVNTIMQQFPKLQITSTISGSHAHASYHYFGEACDLASGDYAYMQQAAAWIAANLTPYLTEGIHNPGLSVKNGKPVSSSFWGASTWSEHANHIHVAAAQNSVSSPPGF